MERLFPFEGFCMGATADWHPPVSSHGTFWYTEKLSCPWAAPGSDRILRGTGAGVPTLLSDTSALSSSLQYHWLVPYQPGLDFLGTPVLNEALIQIPLLCEWGGTAEAWSAEDPWVSTDQPEPPSCSTGEGALGNKEKKNHPSTRLGCCSLHLWGEMMTWSGNTDKLCVSRSQQIGRTSQPTA